MYTTINYQETNKLIGKTIAKYRQQNGYTQEKLAELLQLGNETVSRMERGLIMPNVARLLELAEIFGCSASDLLGGGSVRINDHSRRIENLLADLSESDRDLLMDCMERLANRLKEKES
ncbi:MAG: helix-turn-helix transcriptional regulator [Moraxella sp.]|uniref:helix-turn-helix domain-containing protein n=1 Tax=Moraxella sp. TaxID=479 RepID=UPI0026DCDE0A|nr:helix-turn-helix transcriptional regulator [Moraxella sp.]MDO4449752.1 helix-turn-helix transcriptional regulator [Moraxella sp.]